MRRMKRGEVARTRFEAGNGTGERPFPIGMGIPPEDPWGTTDIGAQFALAHATCAEGLARTFKEIVPLRHATVREASLLVLKPGIGRLQSFARVSGGGEAARTDLRAAGESRVTVCFKILDEEGDVTMCGTFEWHLMGDGCDA